MPHMCSHWNKDPVNIEGNAESARVMGLMPWMDYEFQVIASNILGSGEPSMPSHTIRTQQAGESDCISCPGQPSCQLRAVPRSQPRSAS